MTNDERRSSMFGTKKKPTMPPFIHAPDCKLVAREPDFKPVWNEVESGHYVAICQCGKQHHREPLMDRRVRLDPLDPKTTRHLPQCEQLDTTDPALLRAILKVQAGSGGDYHWVTCGACDGSWAVPYYAGGRSSDDAE
jgi:hypothetical protein